MMTMSVSRCHPCSVEGKYPTDDDAPTEIIASTARRARLAISRSTTTSVVPSRKQLSRTSGVVIFMYTHSAFAFTGSHLIEGLALRS